jgi:hypothetical protein
MTGAGQPRSESAKLDRRKGGMPEPEELARLKAEAVIEKQEKRRQEREAKHASLRALTGELLDAIGAPRLLVVDDEVFSVDPYLQAYVAAPDELENLFEDRDARTENAAWSDGVRHQWEKRAPEQQEVLLERSRAILAKNDAPLPTVPLEMLKEIFPAGRMDVIGPKEWVRDGAQLTKDDPPPIVLFDQELGDFGSTGMDLLCEYRETRKMAEGLELPAGILSREVTEDGQLRNQPDSEEGKVPRGSLMLISKEHLVEDQLPQAVELFRLTANLPRLQSARKHVLEGLENDVAGAIRDANDISPRVLEDVVYRSSFEEGAWEGETMARVAGLLLRKRTRDRELTDTQLREVVAHARRLSRHVDTVDAASPAEASKLQQIENYVPADWVNTLKLPLANGDIFEWAREVHAPGGEEVVVECGNYVLVVQPCDLVLRSRTGLREARDGRLLPIQSVSKAPSERLLELGMPPGSPDALPTFGVVQLKKGFYVDLDILDLCWFNEDGATEIADVNAADTSERMLTEGMILRRGHLLQKTAGSLDYLAKVSKRGKALGSQSVRQFARGDIGLDYDQAQPRRWRYPLRRVARLSDRQAEALLVRYSAAQARAAFDHELDAFGPPKGQG